MTALVERALPKSDAAGFLVFLMMWNQSQGQGLPEVHRLMARWLEMQGQARGPAGARRERRLLILAFRGCGKSTLVGLYAAWRLVRHPGLRVLVLAADEALAARMVRHVKRVIERHPLASGLRPERPDQWAADRFTLNRRQELREPSMLARGIDGNITGTRADLVICDDVEVPNTCATAEARATLRDRLAEIDFVLTPGGMQLYIGTPHHADSLYAAPEAAATAGKPAFLDGFERLTVPVLDAAGRSAWPERFPATKIEALRRRAGPLKFASQMMLEAVAPEAGRLDPAQLGRYSADLDYHEARGQPVLTLDGVRLMSASAWWDPAFGLSRQTGAKTRGDSSVAACLFSDAQGRYWLHDIRYLQLDPGSAEDEARQQCAQIAGFLAENCLPAIAVEINGIGRFLPGLLRQILAEQRIEASVIEVTSRKPKAIRIVEAFDAVLAAGALHAHERVWSTPLIDEFTDWRPGKAAPGCDDGLDAVAGCLSMQPVRFTRPVMKPGDTAARPRPGWTGHAV